VVVLNLIFVYKLYFFILDLNSDLYAGTILSQFHSSHENNFLVILSNLKLFVLVSLLLNFLESQFWFET